MAGPRPGCDQCHRRRDRRCGSAIPIRKGARKRGVRRRKAKRGCEGEGWKWGGMTQIIRLTPSFMQTAAHHLTAPAWSKFAPKAFHRADEHIHYAIVRLR